MLKWQHHVIVLVAFEFRGVYCITNNLVLKKARLREVTCIARKCQLRIMGMWRDSLRRIPLIGFFPNGIRAAESCREGITVKSGGVLFEGNGYG